MAKYYRVILSIDVTAKSEEQAIEEFAKRVISHSTMKDYEIYQLSSRGGEKYGTKPRTA